MERKVIVQNETGIHARPASLLVKKANQFKSQVEMEYKGKRFNAKSIMLVMSMGVTKGSELTIIAHGEDEAQAVKELAELVESNFDEN